MTNTLITRLFLSLTLILGTIVATYLFSVLSQDTYVTSDSRSDKCREVTGVPGDVADSLLSDQQNCRITNKGSFHKMTYIRVACMSKQDDSYRRHIFGSKEACGAFKTLTGSEYIKLHLTTWIAPELDSK